MHELYNGYDGTETLCHKSIIITRMFFNLPEQCGETVSHIPVVASSPLALALSWQDSYINKMTYKRSKLAQTDLVFGL